MTPEQKAKSAATRKRNAAIKAQFLAQLFKRANEHNNKTAAMRLKLRKLKAAATYQVPAGNPDIKGNENMRAVAETMVTKVSEQIANAKLDFSRAIGTDLPRTVADLLALRKAARS